MDVAMTPAGEKLAPKALGVDMVDLTSEVGVSANDPANNPDINEGASHLGSESSDGDSDEGWESDSLYEDALQVIGDEQLRDGIPDACTLEEALSFRRRLHDIGQVAFAEETIGRGTITAKKLCTAFGIMPPSFLEGAPDKAYNPLLILGMSREYSKRLKLPEYNTIDDAVELLKKSKNIIVLTGAGISTSLGIPDFRSKDVGLYAKLEHLGLSDPQEVFDIEIFREDPSIFYSVAKDILPTNKMFSPTHAFIRLLQDKEKLLTNFTQNIDNLEANAGIIPEKLIQCHGSFATATCMDCKHQIAGHQIIDIIRKGDIPQCDSCTGKSESESLGMKRKRDSNGWEKKKRSRGDFDDDSETEACNTPTSGVMKPDITFFGEDLPDSFKRRLIDHDRERADLVIVIGTSLKVAPVAEVPGIIPSGVPQLFISRTPVSHIEFDIDMLGDCDLVVTELCRRAGWKLRHDMIPKDQRINVNHEEGFASRYTFTAINTESA